MWVRRRRAWEISETLATPEHLFFDRRQALSLLGAAGVAAALPRVARAETDPTADLYPAPRNLRYALDRALTPEDVNAAYNNFYEFGSHKFIAREAQRLKTRPWNILIDGLVEKPFEIGIDDLVRQMELEERLYRVRCVEAWSMTIPWTGFPLAKLVALAKPLGSAKFVRFETFRNPIVATGQKQTWYPWPYIEGLTMAEATNELAFLATGAYGKPIAKQHGAPIRLAVPWKYGFKSIKSIVRVSFTDQRPKSFWEAIQPDEYGFWANVNPAVPHPRWSQATEKVLHTGERVPTLIYNGYGEQVAGLYANADKSERLFT